MAQNAKPVIAYENNIAEGTLSASTEATGYPKESLGDWRTYTRWKGTGSAEQWIQIDAGDGKTFSVNCLGLSGHDLSTQGVQNLVLKYSDDAQSWSNCLDPFNPQSDKTVFKTFTERNKRYFRLVIPAGYTAPPQIGVLFVGSYFSFPVYAEPGFDPDSQEKIFEGQWSGEGHLLGEVEKYTRREIHARFQRLQNTFIVNIFLPFWNSHVPSPFYYAWDINNHPDDVYLVSITRGRLSMPYTANTRSLDLEMAGVRE